MPKKESATQTVGDHLFVLTTYKSPAWCDHCRNFIWGFHNQGWKCSHCHLDAHEKCLKTIKLPCSESKSSNSFRRASYVRPQLSKDQTVTVNGHEFAEMTYMSPTWCQQCNNFIWGFQKQGWQCKNCKVDVHSKCIHNVAFPCRRNPTKRFSTSTSDISQSLFDVIPGFILDDESSFESSGELKAQAERTHLITNPDADVLWFNSYFVGYEYGNFVLYKPKEEEDNFILSVTPEIELQPGDKQVFQYRVIIWLATGKEQLILTRDKGKHDLNVGEILTLAYPTLSSQSQSTLKKIESNGPQVEKLEKKLLALENEICTNEFSIGVVYFGSDCRTRNDIFRGANDPKTSPAFEEFLSVIGEKIPLKNWIGYNGSLDTSSDLTNGTHSLFAKYYGNNIMFHVSSMLQLPIQTSLLDLIEAQNSPDFQPDHETDPWRIVSKDVVCIVFFEDPSCKFSPTLLESKYIQTYLGVSVQQSPKTHESHYSIQVLTNDSMPPFGPQLSQTWYQDKKEFRDVLLAKAINACKAGYLSAVFLEERKKRFGALLQDIRDNYFADAKKTPITALINSNPKTIDVRSEP